MQKLTFEDICEKLKKVENFTLARVGDGEWRAITGDPGQNCDGHRYFPEMSKELADIVRSNPPYYLASHLVSSDVDREVVEKWQKENNIKVQWACTAGIFHEAFVDNKMNAFFDSIKSRKVLLVGPYHLRNQNKVKFYDFVEARKENCYLQSKEIVPKIKEQLHPDIVVLFCASMASNVWIDKLYSPDYTLIDFGSALDPYCGVLSRSFHRKNQHLIN